MPSKPHCYLIFDLLYHKQGSIMGYCTSLMAIYLQEYQFSLAGIGLSGKNACTKIHQKTIPGILANQENNNIILSMVAYFMLLTTFSTNKIRQQGLA